jgi:hypothetical protein
MEDHVLGVFLRLVFVKQGDLLAHHRLHRLALVADWLSDGDDPDAMLGQLPKVKLLLERFAEKPAVTVDENQLECLLPIAGALDHLLEDRSAVVTGRSAALDELCGHRIALHAAPAFQLAALVGNGKIVLSLPAGRYPHVERGAPCNRILRRRIRRLFATSHVGSPAMAEIIFAVTWMPAKSRFGCYSRFPNAPSRRAPR